MHPILIAGALLASAPILLHLILRQEPQRLPLPTLRFLQQRQRTNQRKLRLRHLLLLALRMLVILLFALTLFQPILSDTGIVLDGDQPIAAALIFDTSPSMGYTAPDRSRLEEARARALTLLDDFPVGSRVAVIDPADPALPDWEPSLGEARKRIERLTVRGASVPLNRGLAAAYQLLQKVDAERDSAEAGVIPRLVVLFGDRATASWETTALTDLLRLREAIPLPAPVQLFADVGSEAPANVAILSATVTPSEVPQGQPVTLQVALQATGTDAPATVVRWELDGNSPERKSVPLVAGIPVTVPIPLRDLAVGPHRVTVSLEAADALMMDRSIKERLFDVSVIIRVTYSLIVIFYNFWNI